MVETTLGRRGRAARPVAGLRARDGDPDGAADRRRAVLPAPAGGHRGRHDRRPHPDLRVQGRRDRRSVPGRCSSRRSPPASAVRVITEAAFSQPGLGSKAFYDSLVAGGVQVVANQGAFLDLDGPLDKRYIDWRLDDLGHFDHRKVVVIDGRIGFVGGPGIEDHYATGTHDLMVRLEGPIVAQLQAVFLLSWHFQGGPLPASPTRSPLLPGDRSTGTGPRSRSSTTTRARVTCRSGPPSCSAVEGASQPSLRDQPLPRRPRDPAWARSTLPGRGVDVRVIVPGEPALAAGERRRSATGSERSSTPAPTSVSTPRWPTPRSSSSDDTVLVGTANLDALSLRQNWEMQLRIEDPPSRTSSPASCSTTTSRSRRRPGCRAGWRERAVNALMSAMSPLL